MVWLPERYPLQAPLMYVCPTPNMIIKGSHSFVDGSGLVHSPCIAHWMPNSDLSSAVQEMAMLFSAEPPLYTKPPGYVPPPVTAAAPGGPHSSGSAGAAGGGAGSSSGHPYYAAPYQQQQLAPAMQQQQQQQHLPAQQAAAAGSYGFGQQSVPDQALAGHALWGGAYAAAAAATASGGNSSSRPPGPPPPPAAAAATATQPVDPKQAQVDATVAQFQVGLSCLPASLHWCKASGGTGGAVCQHPRSLSHSHTAARRAWNCLPLPPAQGLAARALAGRLQAGLEAYNRHATDEMDQLLEVQRNLMARERQLQELVSGGVSALGRGVRASSWHCAVPHTLMLCACPCIRQRGAPLLPPPCLLGASGVVDPAGAAGHRGARGRPG
jgi:hypothetical protein